jgi:hypothetical protein
LFGVKPPRSYSQTNSLKALERYYSNEIAKKLQGLPDWKKKQQATRAMREIGQFLDKTRQRTFDYEQEQTQRSNRAAERKSSQMRIPASSHRTRWTPEQVEAQGRYTADKGFFVEPSPTGGSTIWQVNDPEGQFYKDPMEVASTPGQTGAKWDFIPVTDPASGFTEDPQRPGFYRNMQTGAGAYAGDIWFPGLNQLRRVDNTSLGGADSPFRASGTTGATSSASQGPQWTPGQSGPGGWSYRNDGGRDRWLRSGPGGNTEQTFEPPPGWEQGEETQTLPTGYQPGANYTRVAPLFTQIRSREDFDRWNELSGGALKRQIGQGNPSYWMLEQGGQMMDKEALRKQALRRAQSLPYSSRASVIAKIQSPDWEPRGIDKRQLNTVRPDNWIGGVLPGFRGAGSSTFAHRTIPAGGQYNQYRNAPMGSVITDPTRRGSAGAERQFEQEMSYPEKFWEKYFPRPDPKVPPAPPPPQRQQTVNYGDDHRQNEVPPAGGGQQQGWSPKRREWAWG